MPRYLRPQLTDVKVRKAAPGLKARKLADGNGLYLYVPTAGAKWWRFDYRVADKRKSISLGTLAKVKLAAARKRCAAARQQLTEGLDPSKVRRDARHAQRAASANSFEIVAREWLGKRAAKLDPSTLKKKTWILETFVFPTLGGLPIANLEPPDILPVLQVIESRGTLETAHRAKQICGEVLRYAVVTGRARRDATADLRGALTPVTVTHHAAVTAPAAIGQLLRALERFDGSFVVGSALKLAPLVWVRPGELRAAEWTEVDLDEAMWRIPAERMKMREPHLVPLAHQAVAILRAVHPLTKGGRFVFPSRRTAQRPMSDATLNASLRRLGYESHEMTAHGFRTMASTRLNELGYRPDLIERQLAHVEANAVRAAYNRALYLEERRAMMQSWADELDRLRQAATAGAL